MSEQMKAEDVVPAYLDGDMKTVLTSKQASLINDLKVQLSIDENKFCDPIIKLLIRLGYKPQRRKKSTFVIDFIKHGRIIIKFEIGHGSQLKFWIRYSACASYPAIFQNAANLRNNAWVKQGKYWTNHDINNCCGLCNSKPSLYHVLNDDGTTVYTCGGFTKHVPGITFEDVPDVLLMVKEQDYYFNEAFVLRED